MDHSTAITANQRLKAQSIEAILGAAGECYVEKGFSATTVDDIASRAQVGRATVFRHFKTKESIFVEYVQNECRTIMARLEQILTQVKTPEDYVTTLLLFTICEGPKEPLQKITTANYHGRAYSFDLSFLSDSADKFLANTLPPFYQMAKNNGRLRKGVTLEVMITWIKRLNISFVQHPMREIHNRDKVKQYLNTFVVPSLFREQTS